MKRCLILVYLTITTALARADVPTAESLFAEGQIAYAHDDFATAIAKWQVAYELSRENGLLFNIAQAQRRAGDCEALATYRRFIAADPDLTSEQHRLAEDLARELAGRCGAAKPLATMPDHPVAIEPLAATPDHPTPKPTEHPGQMLRITGLVTGGAGLVSLAAGLALGHHARTLGDEVTQACRTGCDWARWQNQDAAGRRDASIARVLDGLGAASIVVGVTAYYLGFRRGALTVTPRAREGGAVVSWSHGLP